MEFPMYPNDDDDRERALVGFSIGTSHIRYYLAQFDAATKGETP